MGLRSHPRFYPADASSAIHTQNTQASAGPKQSGSLPKDLGRIVDVGETLNAHHSVDTRVGQVVDEKILKPVLWIGAVHRLPQCVLALCFTDP